MKLKYLLGLSIIFMLAACDKENTELETEAEPPLELLKDSVSYTVNGEKYTSSNVERASIYTTESNTKITSGVNFNYLIQGDKDSILFVRDFTIKAVNSFMFLSFIKVYSNAETTNTNENNGSYLNFPKNKTDMFSTGMYKYSTDFWRDNSISGIAIRMINTRGDFKSYGENDLSKPASITQTDQQNSKFEIISLQKRKSDYLLEAKFNLNVFDAKKQVQKIENGYLRFSILKVN
ncbi:hypothetical protein [Pedobacter sp.]|uniref:hypothetical protein n=1 Tax=Pedobacter sp. TaxID=1411316 RepID=UPI003D7F8D01